MCSGYGIRKWSHVGLFRFCPAVGAVVLASTSFLALAPVHAQKAPGLEKEQWLQLERDRESEFENYFGEDLASVSKTAAETADELHRLSVATGTRSALLYVIPRRTHLHLVLIPPQGVPIVKDFYEVTDPVLFGVIRDFHRGIVRLDEEATKAGGQQLYDWIIRPYRKELEKSQIDLLLFCLGDGVKDLALSALSDQGRYLIEEYLLARIPAFNLIDTAYRPFRSGRLLAVGASQFKDERIPALPGAELELSTLVQSLPRETGYRWNVQRLDNQSFTQKGVNAAIHSRPVSVIHVATHAQFMPGKAEASYVQLWDQRLRLSDLEEIDWSQSGADLVVFSACQTALGDKDAANGFAGIALKAGVPSAIGTLWPVDDKTTTSLMRSFYQTLPDSRTKAEALQAAQISVLRGSNSSSGQQSDQAPYYWAGFSLISSPW